MQLLATLLSNDDAEGVCEWLQDHAGPDGDLGRAVARLKNRTTQKRPGTENGRGAATLPRPGTLCGPFLLQTQLGSGGTGVVFQAVRDDAFQQKVAVKVLHTLNPKVRTLFQRECRILAQLNHPYIAHLIETGELANGQPWIAIEHIEGQNLDVYLQKQQPDLSQRIELALKMCQAVSHAHNHMVIHRDLKPENVMINADGNPKLLDFGIAVTFKPDTNAPARETELGNMMTVRYASPEQIGGQNLQAASDVYSLGVVIYEMLTGKLPYQVDCDNVAELMQAVRHGHVVPPSRNTTQERAVDSGTHRHRVRQLRGDLDTILLKALAQEPKHRYASVEAFAGDLSAYQAGLPIQARRATRTYLFRKFIARHPIPSALAATFLASVLTFILLLSAQQKKILEERDLAQREKQTAETVVTFIESMFDQIDPFSSYGREVTAYEVMRLGRERIELDLADEPEIQNRLFSTIGRVYHSVGHFEEARALLDRAVHNSEPGSPVFLEASLRRLLLLKTLGLGFELEARLKEIVPYWEAGAEPSEVLFYRYWLLVWRGRYQEARRYWSEIEPRIAVLPFQQRMHFDQLTASLLLSLDEQEASASLLKELADRQVQRLGSNHFELAVTFRLRADIEINRENLDEALRLLDASDQIIRDLFGDDHPTMLRNLHRRLSISQLLSQDEQGETLVKQAEAMGARLYQGDHPLLAFTAYHRGQIEIDRGRYEDAEASLRKALAGFLLFNGNEGLMTNKTRGNLGVLLSRMGRVDQAEMVYRESMAHSKAVFGEDHPQTATNLNNLGLLLLDTGKNEEAEHCLLRAYEVIRRSYGQNHVRTSLYANNLGLFYKNLGMFEKAETFYREALALRRELFGDDHPRTAVTAYNLAVLLQTRGDWAQSLDLYDLAYASMEKAYGETHEYTAVTLNGRADLAAWNGRFEAAVADNTRALAMIRELRGDKSPRTMGIWRSRGDIFYRSGLLEEAEAAYREGDAIAQEIELKTFREQAAIYAGLARTLIERARYQEAEPFVVKGLAVVGENETTNYFFSLQVLKVRIHMGLQQWDEADALQRSLLTKARGILPDHHFTLNQIRMERVALLAARNQWDEAEAVFETVNRHFVAALPEDHHHRDFSAAVEGRLRAERGDEAGPEQHRAACDRLADKIGENHFLTRRARNWPEPP
ncbi:tetratricopeptide repeat protein [Acanthopleuribacter pedis]|uniref:Serine/threonine protein kinase n=1 Tax=Acanthopleuribacter pedis TaxID=442870 RepID=A0A8J7U5D9_9BACT|nr:tetratricopeptide repeat protein [Acanthopleuribacter pedis]MBO1319221.1 serine/threonine protein kinase [Acanthopleuribacter pedis]